MSFEADLEACIKAKLREEYSFTYTSIINDAAGAAARLAMSRTLLLKNRSEKRGVRAIDFLDLPAELRNRILEYAVSNGEDICIGPSIIDWTPKPAALQPAITRVSRRLRNDALPMFYATNHFVTRLDSGCMPDYVHGFDTKEVNAWLSAIGQQRIQHIRHFSIRYIEMRTPGRLWNFTEDQIMAETGLALVKGVARFVKEE